MSFHNDCFVLDVHCVCSASRWWQGSFLSEFGDDDSPLFGIDLTIDTAIALAEVLDNISSSKSAKLINFAHIQTDWRLIGQGSFSKVFAGSYKHVPCALKLIFTTDLTAEDVNKATVEATLLSSIRSRNIINIFGICVNPPNVMIALELCELGSLFDVLRNEHLHLSCSDRMFLALGCCRGLDALHNLSDNIVHRDIKSMNFLVDAGLNAKLCDLELGQNETMSKKIMTENESEKFLLNWMAPEFIHYKQYTRASDIYALALVLWEIISCEVPFSNLSQHQISRQVGSEGLRPQIPDCDAGYSQLLTLGWAQEQDIRPSSSDMAVAMGSIWRGSFFRKHVVVETSSNFSKELNKFLASDSASFLSKQLAAGRASDSTNEIEGSGVRMTSFITSMNPLRGSLASPGQGQPSESGTLQHLMSTLQVEVVEGKAWGQSWASIDGLVEPVLVITRDNPFLILGASASVGRLLGVSTKELLGLNLDCYILSDGEGSPALSGRTFLGHEPVRSPLLSSFYKDMLQSERAHTVVYLSHSDGHRIKCSVSSFPVYRFQCNPELDSNANEEAFTQFKDDIRDGDDVLFDRNSAVSKGTGDAFTDMQYCGLLFSQLDVG